MQGSLSNLSNSIAAKIRGEYNNDNINSHNTFYKMGYEYFFFYYLFIITRPKGYIWNAIKVYIHTRHNTVIVLFLFFLHKAEDKNGLDCCVYIYYIVGNF